MKPAMPIVQSIPPRSRIFAWIGKIAHFGAWQLLGQGLQLMTGFFLVRWMSYEAYAQFGLAFGFQCMLSQLVDLGFSSAVIALVGERVHDQALVGRYVRSAWGLRTRMLVILGPLSAVAFAYFAHVHQWPLVTSLLLFCSIIAILFFQGWASTYSPVLLMHGEISLLCRPQVLINLGKLGAVYLLNLLSAVGAVAICWLNALAALAMGYLYRSAARSHLVLSPDTDLETGREIRKYLAPLVPGMIFYSFQAQIQVFLISIFGKTREIAEVAALGRLGQLFLLLVAFNGAILVPYIARVPVKLLGARYLQILLLALGSAAALSISAFVLPGPFLWLLGPKYRGLSLELGLSVTASSLAFLTSTLYSFNNARKWVYHWTGIASISGILTIQAVLLAIMPLHTTLNVMIFSVAAGVYPLIPFTLTAIHGYRRTMAAAASGEALSSPPR